MSIKGSEATTFDELVKARRAFGWEEYSIVVGGFRVDKAVFMDVSAEALEEVADLVVYLRFELEKVETKNLKGPARTLRGFLRTAESLGELLFKYRDTVRVRAPELLEAQEFSEDE